MLCRATITEIKRSDYTEKTIDRRLQHHAVELKYNKLCDKVGDCHLSACEVAALLGLALILYETTCNLASMIFP